MDCVNHSGVTPPPFARTAARHSAPAACATPPEDRFSASPAGPPGKPISSRSSRPPPAAQPCGGRGARHIPGVGAMYNGQFFKGLIHVVIFAVLISITDHFGIFGIFIAAWILYQSFEAFHTAKALRDGQPSPIRWD